MKKNIFYALAAVVVAFALIVSLIFVFSGKGDETAIKLPNLTGTWTVVAVYTDDVPAFTENQFMVFNDETTTVYKDNLDVAYASSTYTINEAAQLLLPDISREYKIEQKTDYCVRLYENSSQYMMLIKNPNAELSPATYTLDDLNGKWNVAMKGDQFNNGEILEFSNGTLSYYKQGTSEPFAVANFTLENGVIKAESLGMEMKCYSTSDHSFALIEQSGIVWELVK